MPNIVDNDNCNCNCNGDGNRNRNRNRNRSSSSSSSDDNGKYPTLVPATTRTTVTRPLRQIASVASNGTAMPYSALRSIGPVAAALVACLAMVGCQPSTLADDGHRQAADVPSARAETAPDVVPDPTASPPAQTPPDVAIGAPSPAAAAASVREPRTP
ncbi:MAG TPA: hypothetical protein VFE72_03065, partial [Lysobacter sp.]|nr:hypothetical protein [Lysobacter sp.]